MVYRLALGTGFRAKELRSLTPESFDLEGEPPTVTVNAAYSKRRREDTQPIRPDLADLLRPWLAGRSAGQPVFANLPGDTARMLRSDLAAAREAWIEAAPADPDRDGRERSDFLKYQNTAGEVADFHSTRHTYISGIVAGNASVKTAQELARHSTPTLTIGRYSHARLHDLQGALEALPSLDAKPDPKRESLRATGTDGTPGGQENPTTCPVEPTPDDCSTWGQKWGQLDGGGWRKTADESPQASGVVATLPLQAQSAEVLVPTRNGNRQRPVADAGGERRRPDSNRGWRICNPLP